MWSKIHAGSFTNLESFSFSALKGLWKGQSVVHLTLHKKEFGSHYSVYHLFPHWHSLSMPPSMPLSGWRYLHSKWPLSSATLAFHLPLPMRGTVYEAFWGFHSKTSPCHRDKLDFTKLLNSERVESHIFWCLSVPLGKSFLKVPLFHQALRSESRLFWTYSATLEFPCPRPVASVSLKTLYLQNCKQIIGILVFSLSTKSWTLPFPLYSEASTLDSDSEYYIDPWQMAMSMHSFIQ